MVSAIIQMKKDNSVGASEIALPDEENERVLTELDALAYAYSKMTFYNGNMPTPKNKLIYARIKSMKRRD